MDDDGHLPEGAEASTNVTSSFGRVAELADAQDSGSCVRKDVGVQVPPRPPTHPPPRSPTHPPANPPHPLARVRRRRGKAAQRAGLDRLLLGHKRTIWRKLPPKSGKATRSLWAATPACADVRGRRARRHPLRRHCPVVAVPRRDEPGPPDALRWRRTPKSPMFPCSRSHPPTISARQLASPERSMAASITARYRNTSGATDTPRFDHRYSRR